MKKAYATRTDGNCYDVTYSDSKAMDRDVTAHYLISLIRDGYVVHVDNNGFDKQRMSVGRLSDGEVSWTAKP